MPLKPYKQIFEEMYSDGQVSGQYQMDELSRKAWKVLEFFQSRKGFDHWWGNIDREIQDEMFDDLRCLLNPITGA